MPNIVSVILSLGLFFISVPTLNAEATDATKSESSGNGLQFATAGVLAQFTVTAKDESGVRRTSGGDEWIVELDGTRSLTGSVVDNLDGTYQVSYTATKSGSYEAGVKLAKSGGLTGSYFENVWFFYTPVKVTVDPQINMDWGVGRITPTGANYISVRWVGKVKTQYAETYTFYATTDDGARLWVDNVPLIDRWDSFCNETSATIALRANIFYNIKMEYKQITGSAFAKLSWASQSTPKEIVPSSQLYYETQAKKSPFSFIVMPNVADGTRSTAAGTGLEVATAGTAAQFTIQANDMYDNERGEGGDIFSVRVYPPNSIEAGLEGRAVHGVVVDNTDSSYSVEYTTYKSGHSTLYAALLVRGGVTATYYDNSDFTLPVKYAEGTTNLQNVQFQPANAYDNDNSVPTVSSFSVRYAGFVAPTRDSTYDFQWDRQNGAAEDRVRVWVDNSLIIDQWTSLAASSPSGAIELRSAYYYDTMVDYKYVSGCTSGTCNALAVLKWRPSGGTMATITSANLYRGYDIMDSPFTVDVKPAGTCSAKSIAVPNQAGSGHSLELSTAGLQAEFTITAKDLYGNLRGVGGDNFRVRLTGVDSTSGLVQDLSDVQPGTYRVVYTVTKSGTYDISVVFGASGINQSPFRMVAQPARRHLGRSVPTGSGLTLGTAGVQSSVTITIRDRHDNWQPDPSVVDANVQFAFTDIATLQATNVVQDALGPDDIPSFVDKVSYIGPSTNAGKQVATPTDLDNPRLILRYTVTRSGTYSMALGGTKANDGAVMGSPFDLTLLANVVCAGTSAALGTGVSLATSGVPGTFTIQARDEYNNLRGSNPNDIFVARVRQFYSNGGSDEAVDGMDVIECGRPGADCASWNTYSWGWTTTGGRDKPATVEDNGDGSYKVSFEATRSATNYVWATYAVPGGLQATYYAGTGDFTATGSSRIIQQDQTVDFSVTDFTSSPYDQTTWSARWTGMVYPSLSETYTFYAGGDVTGSNMKERVKLWVDNSLIIQAWTSLAVSATTEPPSGKIFLEADNYYEILLAGKAATANTTNTAPFQLKWSSNHHATSVISSSRLFMSYHVANSPFALNVLPSTTCAANSRVYRPALTLTTAGVMASFTLQSKDAFDNIRTLMIEDESAFDFAIVANGSLPSDNTEANRIQSSEETGGTRAYSASVFYIGAGGYQVNYTATARGVYNVQGQIMQPGGVFGTYFENDDLTDHGTDTLGVATEAKPYQRMDATIDFDWHGGRPVPAPSTTMTKDIGPSYFSARWTGMLKPEYSEVYTFSIAVDDGAKLWINDLLIVDHWYSRCSEVDGTIALMAGTLYPLKLEYKQVVGNASAHLSWSSRSQDKQIVGSGRLYSNTTTFTLSNRNMSLYVEPAVVCASKSTAEGAGLTGATAGRPSKFTIQSRDEYMNNRKLADSGIRPGNAAFACEDWAHSGTLQSGSVSSTTTIVLDANTASKVDDFYTGRTVTLTGGTGAGQARIVSDYDGTTQTATLYPPLTVVPDATSKYSIGSYGGQWSEKCDMTRTQPFREGYPEFHVRVAPIIEGSQAPYHAAGLVDEALLETYQGSGIVRLSSTEYPGGLTATYYDIAGTDDGTTLTYDPGFSSPVYSTWCTTAQPCDETIDFSHAGGGPLEVYKKTYGEYPEAIGSLGHIAGPLAATYYDHPSKGWVKDERLANSEYGVRWSGFISPTLAGIYTFHAQLSDTSIKDDRVKLWIDDQIVIQQWNSLAVNGKAAGTFYFSGSYPSAYKISLHYKNPTASAANPAGLTLRWENLATASVLSGINAFHWNHAGPCSEADSENVCLATVSTTAPYPQVFSSTFGAASEYDDTYIAQTMRLITPGQAEEVKIVKDYTGVVKGTVSKAATSLNETFLDSDASTTDNFYVGFYILITSGTGAGEMAVITNYTGCSQSGCDPYTGTLADASTTICDCSGADARKVVHADFATLTDTTSTYSIFMYKAELSAALATAKTAYTKFSVSKGYTLVTYGHADCAEFTGTAQSGGASTITSDPVSAGATFIDVESSATLFGGVDTSAVNPTLWVSIGSDHDIQVTNVVSNRLTTTGTSITVGSTCTLSSPCTVTPRSTMVLAADGNTLADLYDGYFIQILSGSCAGQWREVVASEYNNDYVTIAVGAPWSRESTSKYLGCTAPDSSSVYYLSKACTGNITTLQTVGPISALTIKPGADGEAIRESAQGNVGYSTTGQWGPIFYDQLSTQGDNYPYPYQPFDQPCCAALSGAANNNAYNDMLIVITSGTGRGQRRFASTYSGTTMQLTVSPNWDILPDSTSRYAIYKAKIDDTATNAAPIIPSSRLFPLRSRYEVTYTPTVKGDYQVHASLAQGSGLDATYYDDMELTEPVSSWKEDQIDFDVADSQSGFDNTVPRSFGDLGLSDKQSFSVRWAGLLQLFDDTYDTTPEVFTFEAGIAETDERVKLWVDNSLIIDRWETYDYLSATTFSATIALRSPFYYDLKMEYKQFAGAAAKAVLRWQCGITGSPCESKVLIPSSNLFLAREISGSPFPPHEVQPAETCAATSTVRGIPLSLATAGMMDSFTIQSHDEYDNERGYGGDHWVVRAVPYNTWDTLEPYDAGRSSKDCIGCPRTVYGEVEDMGDSSYMASFTGTKRGAYKVLTSLAMQGGMFATYYQGTGMATSRFHRAGQVGDSESDWPAPCVYREDFRSTDQTGYTDFTATVGAWRGALAEATGITSGLWHGKYQCQNWISGMAQEGFCTQDRTYFAADAANGDFAQCLEYTSANETAIEVSGTTTVRTEAMSRKDDSLLGMVMYIVGGDTGVGVWSVISGFTNETATVNFPEAPTGTVTYRIFNCGTNPLVTTETACGDASTVLSPTSWITPSTSSIVLDMASSDINDAYLEWDVKIVAGSCMGQTRRIAGYIGANRLASLNDTWATADGTETDPYGRLLDIFGCTKPDATSKYILYKQDYAPGSLIDTDATFGVRWAGFVKPSSTAEYTFQSLLSTTTGVPNDERVKLWVDNNLIIDQWASLFSNTPSGTIAFAKASEQLYDIQVEYKRQGSPTTFTNEPPLFSLRWKNEQSGSDASLSEAYDYKIIASHRLYTNYPVPNSRVLDIEVAETCATVSTVAGHGLTTGTAGSTAYFTITARDAYSNERELEEDSFIVDVYGPNGFAVNAFPEPSPLMPGTYNVEYVATQSGSYEIAVRRASAGGLMGEYFNNMWLLGDPAIENVDMEIDFSWGTGAIAPPDSSSDVITGSDYMSVRWSGLFKPELSEVYTFFTDVDNGARMFVDGELVVDNWDVTAASEYSATLNAVSGLMYELKVEYRHTTGDAYSTISYSSPSVAKRPIPSSRLYHTPVHVFGSPFSSYISPGDTCSTTSTATGTGLEFATAGHYASFTLQARDEYMNTRTKWEDTFIVKASHTDHLSRAKTGTVSANIVKGKYNVAYLATKAGPMNIYTALAVAGGIQATYYDGVAATFYSAAAGKFYGEYNLPAKARVDENIYLNNYMSITGGGDSGVTGCACAALPATTASGTAQSAGGACACEPTSLVQDQVFAARWSGLIRPSTAAQYTFHVIKTAHAADQERVKLWLDNKLVIDQWNSLAVASPTTTFSFPVAMDYYEVEMEYRTLSATQAVSAYNTDGTDSPACQLAISQANVAAAGQKIVTSSYLAQSADVSNSPYAVTVKPDVTDWAVSTMTGEALTVASAGITSEFTIQSYDTWGNIKTSGGDQYLAHISSVGGGVFEGTVTDVTDGTYTVAYTPEQQGIYDMKVYLGSSDKTTTLLVQPGLTCATTSYANSIALTIATAGYAATFTIQAKDAFENVRTVGDNEFVARITSGSEVHNNPVNYIGASPNTNLGRYQVAYRTTKSGFFTVDIKLASGSGLTGNYYRDDTLTNKVLEQVDTNFAMNWGTDSPDSTFVGIVDGFSIEWTGYVKPGSSEEYTFKTTVAGDDERVKLWIDDRWVVDQWNSLATTSPSPSGTVWLVANTLYDVRMQYKDYFGSAELTLEWESDGEGAGTIPDDALFPTATSVDGSPFAATVYPALTSGTVSTAIGAGLSVATAGTPASFTIMAKDHLGNMKTTADDTFVARVRHNKDYTTRNIPGTVTSLGDGLYSVSYTPQWKRNKYSCAGAGSSNTCNLPYDFTGEISGAAGSIVPPQANRIGNLHKFHDVVVSQALVGGLHATYYTAAQTDADISNVDPSVYMGPGLPYRTKVVPTVEQTFEDAPTGSIDSVDASWGVRYVGFFAPPTGGEAYTFHVNVDGNSNERVRLWLDNSLIIDEWNQLTSTSVSASIQLGVADQLYDLVIEYKQEDTADAAFLALQYSYAAETTAVTIPSTRLYMRHDLSFKIYDQMGLTATYYDLAPSGDTTLVEGASLNYTKAVQESTVDWSGATATDRPYPESVTNGEFSVRWSGFIQPSRVDEYTFFIGLQGGTTTTERVQLWLDNELVIEQWASLASTEPSGTISFDISDDYYNIMIDYKVLAATATRGLSLKWENDAQEFALYGGPEVPTADRVAKNVVPADRLYQVRTSYAVDRDDRTIWDSDYHADGVATLEDRTIADPSGQWAKLNGCPSTPGTARYDRCRGQGVRTSEVLRVDVHPGAICASKSTLSGDSDVSLTTAGITRTFTLTARDAYDNQRDATDDSFIARAVLWDGSDDELPFHGAWVHQDWDFLRLDGETNPPWDQNGKYESSYIVTRAGRYTLTVQSADVAGNGLFGTYFSTNRLTGTAVTQTDLDVNFNWGRGDPTTSTAIVAGSFSVRWSAYVKSPYTEVYTFYTDCDYGVRLFVNEQPLVNQWGAAGAEYSGTISMVSGVLYDLVLEYQTIGEISYCSLSWSSPSTEKAIVPSSAFRVEAQTISSGTFELATRPSVISGSVSGIYGPGLSIATAGIPASFTVLSKDMYGNLRDSCADLMYVRMVPDPPTCTLGDYPYDWSASSGAGGAGNFFSCTSVGKIQLQTTDTNAMTDQLTNDNNHGVLGTYNAYGFLKAIPADTGDSWSDVSTACTRAEFTGNKHPFSYVQTRAGSHTLYASETPGGIGQTYAAAAGSGLMATYYETSNFGTPRNAYDCVVPAQAYDSAPCVAGLGSVDFSTSNTDAPFSLMSDGVFSARWTGLIRPDAVTADTEYTFEARLTSGGAAVDERVKLWIDNSLLIDQWTSLLAVNVTATAVVTANQLYDIKVEYKNTVGGSSDNSQLQLRWESDATTNAIIPSDRLYPSHSLGNSPQRLRVNPNVAFARECEVYGQGLTIGTAGLQATFAIQSKDAYNNIRGTGGDLFVVRAFSDGCQEIRNDQDLKQTCQPYGPAIGTCGNAGDPECPASTNPAPETNDGGDDDGDWSAGVVSRKPGGAYRTDVSSSICENCPRILRANVVDNGDSTYTASFTGTQKGRYTVVTSLVNSGGLASTYYDGDPVSTDAQYTYSTTGIAYRVDTTVDWSSSVVNTQPSVTLANADFSVRWVGFVRPSRASQYTFHSELNTAASERVKLWVDNSIIIQQWASLASTAPSGTIGFAKGNGYYDISMLYKCKGSTARCKHRLLWENTASGISADDVTKGLIPSHRLFQRYDVPNTGLTCSGTPCITKDSSNTTMHTTLQIMPSLTCSSQSTANGDGLTLATAGVAATFTVQSKDAYENTREDTSASFTVDLFGSGGAPIYNGAVASDTASSGNYLASFTAENAKNYDMFVKYGSDNVKGSPFTMTVKPSTTCGTKSTIQGTGLTAASVSPSKSAFTIQARDQYGNAKTQALDSTQGFNVRVVRTSGAGMQGTRGLPAYYGSTAISSSPTVHSTFNTATNDGKYAGYYQVPSTPSPSGYTHYLYASWIAQGTIHATYYTGMSTLSAPVDVLNLGVIPAEKVLTELGSSAALTTSASNNTAGADSLTNAASDWTIRWSGLYKTRATQMYFRWTGVGAGGTPVGDDADRVKLWVDNKIIIDQWTSLAIDQPTGSYLFDTSSGVYDIHAEWGRPAAATTSSTPSVQDGTAAGTYSAITTDRLYVRETVSGSPYAVTVSS
mmetsp:Transcript_34887/g.82189  ORF Transcript_34887/g.82189 Transcript_34887/m.82189 type:complete len:5981 (-) Transcript_34887:63-18005(-)